MASFATQVQIRRGTDAENDAFTGAEGEVTMDLTNKQLRVHDGQTTGGMKIPNIETVFGTNQIADNAVTEEKIADNAITEPKLSTDLQTKINEKTSGAGRNIGDIFWTTRTDSALNGAVEANGAQYNFADVNGGDNNVQALLTSGALPSVSIAEFDAMVAEQGGCDSFGYGTDTQWGKWDGSSLGYVYTKTAPIAVGDPVYDAPGGNIIGHITRIDSEDRTCIYYDKTDGTSGFGYADNWVYGPVEPTTYFKVPKKLGRVLVRSQKPTEDNNYTWFNLYADGWVEQGGQIVNSSTVTLPITMADTNYFTFIAYSKTSSAGTIGANYVSANTQNTTNFTIAKSSILRVWQVSGYADPAEYTKDKWDYQNVQVERPMVQLFNGATDDAVAKCTEVLSDVAGLKQATEGMIDYVVESQEPTEANGYTWYRKYKSGWVEQGGQFVHPRQNTNTEISTTVSLPVIMSNTNYYVSPLTFITDGGNTTDLRNNKNDRTTTALVIYTYSTASILRSYTVNWQVSGMSAQ